MLNYLKNTILKPVSYLGKKSLPIATGCAILISSCAYDIMDVHSRLQRRKANQEQRIQREISKLDDIENEEDRFENALESALKEIRKSKESIPESGEENDQ